MKEIELKTLNNAIRLLNAIKCNYAIIDIDGNKHGTLKIVKKKIEHKYPHGSITKHVRQYFVPLEVGNSFEIPIGDFDYKSVQSVTGYLFSEAWGKGNYTSCYIKENTAIQVLRLA